MYISQLKINNYRNFIDFQIDLKPFTLLIGENNSGKSGVLQALDILLSGENKLSAENYYSISEEYTGDDGKPSIRNKRIAEEVIFEAEFRDVPLEAREWRGFKGRLFNYTIPPDSGESGVRVYFRKIFEFGNN